MLTVFIICCEYSCIYKFFVYPSIIVGFRLKPLGRATIVFPGGNDSI